MKNVLKTILKATIGALALVGVITTTFVASNWKHIQSQIQVHEFFYIMEKNGYKCRAQFGGNHFIKGMVMQCVNMKALNNNVNNI